MSEELKKVQTLICFFFWEAMKCLCKRQVNYTFLVYNEDTLRYVYAKLKEKSVYNESE